jgi:hypothetical protein
MNNAPSTSRPLTQAQFSSLLDAAKHRAHELRREESGRLWDASGRALGRLWRAVRPPVRGAV